MKRLILFTLLFVFSVFTVLDAENILLGKKNQSEMQTRPRAPMFIPITVDISPTDLYLNFITPVGVATITVINSNNLVVYQQSLDTYTDYVLSVPVDTMDSGSYTVEINYGSITLAGSFELN